MGIPTSNLAHLLLQTARRFPDRDALIWRDRRWSWAEQTVRVRAAAGQMAAAGIVPGDRILVQARNSNALIEVMWACWMIGAVFVPTNFRLTPAEVAYLAEASRARAHIFDAAFPEHQEAARAANPTATLHIAIDPTGGAGTWEAMASASAPGPEYPVDVAHDHPCWFFYTSATTGRPKAAVLTHGQMEFVVTSHLCDLMPGTTEHDVSLVVAPLSHGAGVHALAQVARGAASVLLSGERLDCTEAWALVERHRVTNMFTVPTILTMLTRDPAVSRYDHASLRYVIYAGAPMYRADQQHALRVLGKVLVQYFGLGEVTGNITVLPPHLHSAEDDPAMPIGSCGAPRTGMEIAILDPAGNRLGPLATGEICVRGPAVFTGYFENPEANAKSFAHGWFNTGDLGHLDARGFLYITGRASDMYISGGSNVYPREAEELLLTHPAIAEVCVLGMPDPKWGECGVAVLVPAPGLQLDMAALPALLDGRLARYKWPARYVLWPALPKSGYGKVVKREVRRLLEENGA